MWALGVPACRLILSAGITGHRRSGEEVNSRQRGDKRLVHGERYVFWGIAWISETGRSLSSCSACLDQSGGSSQKMPGNPPSTLPQSAHVPICHRHTSYVNGVTGRGWAPRAGTHALASCRTPVLEAIVPVHQRRRALSRGIGEDRAAKRRGGVPCFPQGDKTGAASTSEPTGRRRRPTGPASLLRSPSGASEGAVGDHILQLVDGRLRYQGVVRVQQEAEDVRRRLSAVLGHELSDEVLRLPGESQRAQSIKAIPRHGFLGCELTV